MSIEHFPKIEGLPQQPINNQQISEKVHADLSIDFEERKAIQQKKDEQKIAEIRESLGIKHPNSEGSLVPLDNEKLTIKTIEDLKKIAEKTGDVILYHGGLPDDTDMEKIDLNRHGAQQNKKGRTYGGFYLTDDSSKSWSEQYAQARNGNMHGFLIAESSRILEIRDRNIDRLSQEDRDEFAKKYDLLKGNDLLGRIQFVLLNKDVVKELGIEKLKK